MKIQKGGGQDGEPESQSASNQTSCAAFAPRDEDVPWLVPKIEKPQDISGVQISALPSKSECPDRSDVSDALPVSRLHAGILQDPDGDVRPVRGDLLAGTHRLHFSRAWTQRKYLVPVRY
jgi:hypothetical protein